MAFIREYLSISNEYEIDKHLRCGGINLRISNQKAVSTLTLIILMLCSAVFGAFISYMLVIANFYLEPEDTVDLVITELNFPVDHADYFDVTIMNPSHSPSGTNITEIYFAVDGEEGVHPVTKTDLGELPIFLERGTSKIIRCFENWGQFAGKIITVHVSATKASGAVRSAETEYVKLDMEIEFDAAVSCKQFNVTIKNHPQSAINLTLTKVYINGETPENIVFLPNRENATFPMGLPSSGNVSFQCFYGWESLVNPLIRVETSEGYYIEKRANATAIILLLITDVTFNETNTDEINSTILNSEVSRTLVDITDIVLTYGNGTEYKINGSLTDPSFSPYYRLEINETVTFGHCVWNWRNYRDENITITVYTRQGFKSVSKLVITPKPVIFKITELNFNLTNTEHFLVNVANTPCSLQSINVTQIKFNENVTELAPSFGKILPGEERQFSCAFNWTSLRGENVTVTVCTADGLNISKSLILPSIELKISDEIAFAKSTAGIPYVNITILNTVFSARNVTIIQIIFEAENATDNIDGTLTSPNLIPDGYVLIVDANVTITCPWNWILYPNQDLTIIVQTAEGFSISQTFQIPGLAP